MGFVIDRQLEIEAPADVTWKVLTDLGGYGQWNPFVPECRSTLRPGDRIEMRVKLGRRTSRQVEQMLTFEPSQAFSYRMRPLPLGALWLMPVVRRMLGRQLDVGFSGMTQGLKRRAEQMWANTTPTA